MKSLTTTLALAASLFCLPTIGSAESTLTGLVAASGGEGQFDNNRFDYDILGRLSGRG